MSSQRRILRFEPGVADTASFRRREDFDEDLDSADATPRKTLQHVDPEYKRHSWLIW
jgi:hypothetical protein